MHAGASQKHRSGFACFWAENFNGCRLITLLLAVLFCSNSRVDFHTCFLLDSLVPLSMNTIMLNFLFPIFFARDVCAALGPADTGTSDSFSPEHLTSDPQHRKAAWSGGAKLRLKHR